MLSARDRRMRPVRPKQTRGVESRIKLKKYRKATQDEDVSKLGKEKKKSVKINVPSVRQKHNVGDSQGDDDDESTFIEDAAISVSEGEDDDDFEDEQTGHHTKMLETIRNLDRKNDKQARRSEPVQEVSELNLRPSEGLFSLLTMWEFCLSVNSLCNELIICGIIFMVR
jgi:hypothetical protein